MDYKDSKYNTAACLPNDKQDETVKIYIPGSFSSAQESDILNEEKIRIYRRKNSGKDERTESGMLSSVSDDL